MRAMTNPDYRAHSAPLFSRLGVLDIFQVNSFHVAKLMLCYHKEIFLPTFLDLFVTIVVKY